MDSTQITKERCSKWAVKGLMTQERMETDTAQEQINSSNNNKWVA